MEDVIAINDSKYPELLKKINNPPERIYYKGDWPASPSQGGDDSIFENCLGVVGSRRMTTYGKQITNQLVTKIAGAGVTIVSGFMYGIDATAHRAALNGEGKTIAVMPCGVDIVHPGYQKELYKKILERGGLIISEFEKGFPPDTWTYPKRNRIVAGLSKAVMVVEAAKKSGSLITANFAKKYKRKLFAVPGPLTSASSQGTTQLIKEGADIVTSPGDILDFYNIKSKTGKDSLNSFSLNSFQNLNELEKRIMKKLEQEPMEIDALARSMNLPISKINTTLSFMQLKSLIKEENGKYYLE